MAIVTSAGYNGFRVSLNTEEEQTMMRISRVPGVNNAYILERLITNAIKTHTEIILKQLRKTHYDYSKTNNS